MGKKVLIICYYWPPAGGSGVQRHLKFAKYLRSFGWEPVIYTVANGEYPETDPGLLSEVPQGIKVIKRKILEPYTFYKLFSGKKKTEKITPNFFSQENDSFSSRLAIFLRSNFFIPDARMWWIKPSVKYLSSYLAENPVDAIISTGPPHSLHLIGSEISKKLNVPWLADFRDPWTNIDYFKNLNLLPFARKKHEELERNVISSASRVVTVSATWANELSKIGNRNVDVITNGFDESDFDISKVELDKKFTIVHPGMFSKARNHQAFWEALSELCLENSYFEKDLSLIFYGITDPSVTEMAAKYNLSQKVEIKPYLPHSDIVNVMASAWVLLLSIHNSANLKGFIPGKLFEYLASGRPVLCVGPENGDSARIITESKSGLVSEFNDKNKLKINLMVFYSDFINNRRTPGVGNISKFTRKSLTGKLAGILNEMTEIATPIP